MQKLNKLKTLEERQIYNSVELIAKDFMGECNLLTAKVNAANAQRNARIKPEILDMPVLEFLKMCDASEEFRNQNACNKNTNDDAGQSLEVIIPPPYLVPRSRIKHYVHLVESQ